MMSKGMFWWSPPHIQPLTPVSEISEPPESPSPYLDAGADAIELNDELPSESEEPTFATVSFWRLFHYATPFDWLLISLGSFAAMVHGAALPVFLHVFGKILDLLNLHHSRHQNEHHLIHELSKYSSFIIYIAAGTLLAGWIEVTCWILTAERQSSVIRLKYVQVLLNQDMNLFDSFGGNADVISQVSTDIHFLQYTLSDKVGHYIQNMATFVGGLVIGFLNSWQISLVTLGTGPFIVTAGIISNICLHKLAENVQDAYSDAANIAEQAMCYIRTLYAFTNEPLVKYLYANALRTTLRYGVQISRVQGIGLGFIYGLAICSCALQLWFGGYLVEDKKLHGGEIVAATFAVILSGLGLNQAATNLHAFEQSKIAAYRLYDMIVRAPVHKSDGQTFSRVHGHLELRNVYFSYPSRADIPILSGLYLRLPAKKTMALVGRSGSGKTTIISIIERFYEPTLGEVLLDGENIRNLNLEWLRSQIGLVSSEPALLSASIKQNILYGRSFTNMDEIEEAAKIAHAHTFITALPDGYDTQVGSGLILREDQKLKLAIARAALKNPSILLLDEITKNLDVQAERIVQEALDILVLGRSTIIVAHRLASIRNSDVISVLEEGQLVEAGTHAELISIDGTYADLVRFEDSSRFSRRVGSSKEQSAEIEQFRTSIEGADPNLMFDRIPSIKEDDDNLELAMKSLPKLDIRKLRRHPSRQSDPESPVSPLITDPKSHLPSFSTTAAATNLDIVPHRASFVSLCRLSAPEWLYGSIGSIGAALFGAFIPLLAFFVFKVTEKFYDHNPNKQRQQQVMNQWCLGVLALGIATIFASFLQHFYFGIMGEKMTERIRRMMFSAILRNEIGWFDREENSTEALSDRLANDATFVRAAFSNCLSIIIQDATAVIGTVLVCIILQWHLALTLLVTLPFLLISAAAQRKWATGFSESFTNSHKESSGVIEDAVKNIYTIVSYCGGRMVVDVYKKQLLLIQRRTSLQALFIGFLFGAAQFSLFSCNAFILWYGSEILRRRRRRHDDDDDDGSSLPGTLAVYTVFTFAMFALVEPFGLAPYILKSTDSVAPVFRIIDRKPKMMDPDDAAIRLSNIYGSVEFKDVDFFYPTGPEIMVLKNFNLKATGGQTVALVGASGSGKSTVISLIERFYDPSSGSIFLDGKDIRSLNLHWLRSNLGLVQQEPILFSTTIRENILYAKRNASEAEMKEAARIANAHHFITNLPHGYDTHVGAGNGLTIGQKQRVAIARVVLKNAPLLLLDEASAAAASVVGTESSRVVQEALDMLVMGNKTTIIVAHRIPMLKKVDMIAVLHQGEIAEQGSHDSLMERDGLYSRLMQPHISKPLRQHHQQQQQMH